MKLIGGTSIGSLIVELSQAEFDALKPVEPPIQGDPAYVAIDHTFLSGGTHCEYCHSELKGDVCYSCGASYGKELALNG